MRIRAAATTLGIGAGLTAIAISSGAGQAAALTPQIAPELGLYSVELNHSETVALNNTPLPGMLDPLWRDHGVAIIVPPAARSGDDVIVTDLSDAVAASAASTTGEVGLVIFDPRVGPADLDRNLFAVGFLD